MLATGFSVLKSLLSAEAPPTKVQEVKTDAYTSRDILYRDDGMVLYAPQVTSKKEKQYYEIVLHKPYTESLHHAYSLFRTDDRDEAESRFTTFKDKITTLIGIVKEMWNVHGLQKICDTLTVHPSWTLAHLAAEFALYDAFNDEKVNSHLNSSDPSTGMSPLQVAVPTNNLKTVQMLVAANCSLEHLDLGGNSVFHYAASTNKDIILALAQGSSRCLNNRNMNGYTPLHMACLANKPDCVMALLLAGADCNIMASACNEESTGPPGYVGDYLLDNPKSLYHLDMKFGGTPLHWAQSRPIVEALLDKHCKINALNFENRTALHIMVMRGRLDCVVALLSRNADPDLGDKDGNRPIHLAVKQGEVALIQALVIFGADLDVMNNAGETARHLIRSEDEAKLLYFLHAVGATRCPDDMLGCTEGCKFGGTYDGVPPPRVIEPTNRDLLDQILAVAGMEVTSEKYRGRVPKKGRLLCLDGGGIRGLILAQMLLELEKVIGVPIMHCFDWIAGTSTGGIMALAIASGKSMKECLSLYFRMKELTFVGKRPYGSEVLENILKDTFGCDTVMADIKAPKLMIPGVLADRKPVELHLFRNYQSPSSIIGVKHDSPYELPQPPEEQLLWHVGRATGAAPTYFRAFGRFLDGGLIANNPTLDALTEIHEYNLALRAVNRDEEICPVTVVISLGTGLIPVTELKGIDVYRPEGIWDAAKMVMGLPALGNLLVDQATASDGRIVDRARVWCSMIGVPYFRFSPQMSEEIVMDEKSDHKLCQMLWEAKVYMHQNMNMVKEVADIIIRG